MAELPLSTGIPRFKGNEDRFDSFVNGNATQTWLTSGAEVVPTIRKFLADKSVEINVGATSILSAAQNAADISIAKADEAVSAVDEIEAFANSAQVSALLAQEYALLVGLAVYDFNFDSDPATPGYDWNSDT